MYCTSLYIPEADFGHQQSYQYQLPVWNSVVLFVICHISSVSFPVYLVLVLLPISPFLYSSLSPPLFLSLSLSLHLSLSLSLVIRFVGTLVAQFVLSVRGNCLLQFHQLHISSHSLIILLLSAVCCHIRLYKTIIFMLECHLYYLIEINCFALPPSLSLFLSLSLSP